MKCEVPSAVPVPHYALPPTSPLSFPQWGEDSFVFLRPHGLPSRNPSCVFAGTRRSVSSFTKASEDTHCAFLYSLTAVASCVGG